MAGGYVGDIQASFGGQSESSSGGNTVGSSGAGGFPFAAPVSANKSMYLALAAAVVVVYILVKK